MNKKKEGKIIRAAVVAGVVLLHFAVAYVIGGVIQSIYTGRHHEEYAESPAEPATPGANRGPASVTKPRTTRAPSSASASAREDGREIPGEGEITFQAGGEETGGFVEDFFQYLETGNWPKPGEKAASQSGAEKGEIYGIGGGLAGSLGAAGGGSASGGPAATPGSPRINVMAPFFVSNPTGGINGITGAGYRVTATGGASLSSVHGVTSSGYRVWFNQGGQVSAQ